MTCRVARSSADHPRIDWIPRCTCGLPDLQAYSTASAEEPPLCPMCGQAMAGYGNDHEGKRAAPATAP